MASASASAPVVEVEMTEEERLEFQEQQEKSEKLHSKLLAGLGGDDPQPAKKRRKVKGPEKSNAPSASHNAGPDLESTSAGAGASKALLDDVTENCSDAGSKASKTGDKFGELDPEMRKVALAHQAEVLKASGGKNKNISVKALALLRVSTFLSANADHDQGHALAGVGCSKKHDMASDHCMY